MRREIVVQPRPRPWSEAGILRPYVSQYGEHLQRRRYAPSTQLVYVCCVAHFGHWVTQERYDLEAIGQGTVMRFLSEHLPGCACPYPVRRSRHELQAALGHLLEVLQAAGVARQDPDRSSVMRQELARFDAHMRDVWGLTENTRRQRRRVVRGFLLAHFGERPVTMATVSAASIRRFVLGDQGRSPRSIAATGGAIGCYLRFRSLSGDRVSDLSAAIPRAAHWRLASLPEVLTDAEINELLRSFDHPFPSRQRAYAMVRCLIDLGLRCSEVVKLQLDDVNWADGTINLVETKGGRSDVLPLPSVTGAAIASYLREERPPHVEPGHICSPCRPLRRTDQVLDCQAGGHGRLSKMWMDADRSPHSPAQRGQPTSSCRSADEGDRRRSAASKPRYVGHLRKG